MANNLNADPDALREALYELSMAQDVPNARLLDEMARRYPELSEQLTEFAIAIALDALRGEQAQGAAEARRDPDEVSEAVARALSHFQNGLHELKLAREQSGASAARPPPANPFANLGREEFRALATRLNANAVFICKLRDRQIDPATMTTAFVKRVAEELKVSLETLQAHFSASAAWQVGQFYKADEKPVMPAQQSFAEAVRGSDLTPDQQKGLLEM